MGVAFNYLHNLPSSNLLSRITNLIPNLALQNSTTTTTTTETTTTTVASCTEPVLGSIALPPIPLDDAVLNTLIQSKLKKDKIN